MAEPVIVAGADASANIAPEISYPGVSPPGPSAASPAAAPFSPAASARDLPAEAFAEALARREANRAVLLAWIERHFVKGVDYGPVHFVSKSRCKLAAQGKVAECADPAHWSKPALRKPGAEKVLWALALSAHFPRLADYEEAAIGGVDVKRIVLRCELRDGSGRVVAEGAGARDIEDDGGDVNKAIKMAIKNAVCEATLRYAALSGQFDPENETDPPHDPLTVPVSPATISDPPPPPPPPPPTRIDAARIDKLKGRIQELGIPFNRLGSWIQASWNVNGMAQLTEPQAAELERRLPAFAKKVHEERMAAPAGAEPIAQLRGYLAEHGINERLIVAHVKAEALDGITQLQLELGQAYAQQLVAAMAREAKAKAEAKSEEPLDLSQPTSKRRAERSGKAEAH